MTACIVGWAHSRFGKLEGETLESLIAKVAREALDACRHRPGRCRRDRARPFQRRLLAAGFYREPRAAGGRPAALQAGDARRERLRDRLGRGAARHPRHRRAGRAHRAGGRRRADDDDARPGDRQEPAARLLSAGGRRHARPALPASSARSPTPISSAMATSRTRLPRSPPRTTGTASTIPMRRCARISASISAGRRARRTRSSPGR